ncbi:MAG: TIGR03013 family PEP-CTERM/XrtA system glycosyltransferase [Gammaproteobacteria bacterium]
MFRAGKRGHGNPMVILLVVDFLAAALAFCLAMWLRFARSGESLDWYVEATPYPASSFVFWVMVGMLAMGLYRVRQRPTTKEAVARVILAVVLGSLANILFFYMIPGFFVVGRGVMALAMIIAGVMLIGVRLMMLRLIDDNPVKRRVLVVGAGDSASKISMLRRRSDRRRFEAVAYVAIDGDRQRASELGIEPVIDTGEVVDCKFDEIVVALDDRRGMLPMEFLLQFKQRGVPVTDLVDFLERETEYLDLDVLRPSWLLYEKSSETSLIYRLLKRAFDIFFGIVLLILTLPLTVLAVLAILIEDGIRAPIFYRQTRVGRHGRIIRLYKFRSMRVDAERHTGPRWSTAGDDRITRTGRILRRFRIDELPQMLNIIKGDMSVVGPRPERPEFVEELSRQVPLYYYRHGVRPGLTGWAQLNFPYGASVADAREKLQYDLYYIKNASLILDLLILLQTAEVVVWGRGTSMSGAAPGAERRGKPTVPDQPRA